MNKITTILALFISFLATSCLKEDDVAVEIPPLSGTSLAPEVGGGTQPNQVWVDLSDADMKVTHRNKWDLGFYTGDEFYVILNNSIMMAAGAILSTDIDAVNATDFASIKNIIDPGAGFPGTYIDNIKGDYFPNGTAINSISANPDDNFVYLLKLGYKTYEGDIPAYSTYTAGDQRGYKKIRILRNGENSYKVQLADLNATTHQEFIITKDPDYHFTFFSIDTNQIVDVQPKKKDWDLCFTVWNNIIEGHGTYIYPDFVITNRQSGVGAYIITTDALTLESDYNNFSLADVNESLFDYSDHRVIGGNWRSTVSGTTSTPKIFTDCFFVIRDAEGVYFKLRFLSMLNENNERGYPIFEYDPL